jgi:hypothetical protein
VTLQLSARGRCGMAKFGSGTAILPYDALPSLALLIYRIRVPGKFGTANPPDQSLPSFRTRGIAKFGS